MNWEGRGSDTRVRIWTNDPAVIRKCDRLGLAGTRGNGSDDATRFITPLEDFKWGLKTRPNLTDEQRDALRERARQRFGS